MEEKQQFQTIPEEVKAVKKHPVLFKVWIAVSALAIIGVVGGGVLFAVGAVQVTPSADSQKGSSTAIVCDIEDINAYNKVLNVNVMGPEDIEKLDASVADFAKTIQEKSNYDTDPTCLYMVYAAAYRAGENDKASEYLAKIEALSVRNLFIDNRVRGIQSNEEMRSAIEARTQMQQEGNDFTGTSG